MFGFKKKIDTLTGEDLDRARENTRDLVLYQFPACPFCQRVQHHLNERGLTIETRNTQTDPDAREQLLAGGGRTTVPCLYIGNESRWLYESSDIVDFIDQRIGK